MNKDLDFLKSNIIAHRGAFNNKDIPENSIKAFEKAIEKNYIIELDVHILKDNTIVVYHDDNVKRLTGVDKSIIDFNYSQLKELSLLNTKYKIPRLIDVLELVNSKVPIIIEIKFDRKTGVLEKELVKILDNYKGKFAVKSFNIFSVKWFKKNRPNYVRGFLINYNYHILKEVFISNMFLLGVAKPDFLSVNYKFYNKKKITKLRDKLILLAWTIKNKETYELVKNSFDNLICENIERFKDK